MTVCKHGVSQEVKVERTVVGGKLTERFVFKECLDCTQEAGVIVLWEQHTLTPDQTKTDTHQK